MVNPAIQDKRCYWRVRPGAGDQWAVFESKPDAIEYVSAGGDVPEYEIEERWMTSAEFAKLKEHGGW